MPPHSPMSMPLLNATSLKCGMIEKLGCIILTCHETLILLPVPGKTLQATSNLQALGPYKIVEKVGTLDYNGCHSRQTKDLFAM